MKRVTSPGASTVIGIFMLLSRRAIHIVSIFLVGSLAAQVNAAAGPTYDAIDELISQFEQDFGELSKLSPKAALAEVKTSENLDSDVQSYLTKALEGAGGEQAAFRFAQCRECLTVRAETKDNQIFIKRGLEGLSDVQRVTNGLGVKLYGEANLTYTGTRLVLHINIFEAKDGSQKWSKAYSTRVLEISKTGFKISVTLGQIIGLKKKGYPAALSLFFAERIYGFGEFGLVAQGSQDGGELKRDAHIGPMLRLHINEIFSTPWSWGALLWSFRTTYGWYQAKYRDLTYGTGLKLEIGSIYHVSVDYLQGTALNQDKKKIKDNNAEKSEADSGSRDEAEGGKSLPPLIMVGFGFDVG